MSVAVAFAASAMTGRFASMKAVGGIISTSASALFLFAIAIVNMLVRFTRVRSMSGRSGFGESRTLAVAFAVQRTEYQSAPAET